MSSSALTLGYDLDKWTAYGIKEPVVVDLSPATNSHILLCGMSGSGKSYAEQAILARIVQAQPDSEVWFADYKGDDSFAYLHNCSRYCTHKQALEALDAVYGRLTARLSGEDEARHPVILVWDEYMANVLALIGENAKLAKSTMSKVSEILLMGRSMSVRLITSMQRPDAIAFPAGSRLNYGVVIALGAAVRSIYEMLLPDFKEEVKGRQFGRGEGVALLQGSKLHFIKIPEIDNFEKVERLCLGALSKPVLNACEDKQA